MLLAALFLGIIAGWLLRARERAIRAADSVVAIAIYLLLFLLGLSVGGDNSIMGALDELGTQALILSVGSVVGSVLVAAVISGRFFKVDEK